MEAPDNLEFWNRAASSRQFTHVLDSARFTRAVPLNSRILDYGCGQGRLTAELIALGYRGVLGIVQIEEQVELDGHTMNGNPVRILQLWARQT